jgi:hypothetical protein
MSENTRKCRDCIYYDTEHCTGMRVCADWQGKWEPEDAPTWGTMVTRHKPRREEDRSRPHSNTARWNHEKGNSW